MKKPKNSIKEADIYIGNVKDLPEVKPQLKRDDKLYVVGDKTMSKTTPTTTSSSMTENDELSDDNPMIVEYLKDMDGEKPFMLGDIKWQYVWAKYPNGKHDIGVYRYGHDLVYGYKWFKDNIISKSGEDFHDNLQGMRPKTDEAENVGASTPADVSGTGIENRDMTKLKSDVEKLFTKLDLTPIKMALEKINTPVEQYEVIAKFAELIGVPRAKLGKIVNNLKSISVENVNEAVEETEFTTEQKDKIKDFVKNYKGNFKDEDIHKFAGEIKLDKHEVEEYIYSIARDGLNESKNPKMKKIDLVECIRKISNKNNKK